MQKQCSQGNLPRVEADHVPGEFDDLLRQIEKEPVPERLLELALKLQAALVEQRKRSGGEGKRDKA